MVGCGPFGAGPAAGQTDVVINCCLFACWPSARADTEIETAKLPDTPNAYCPVEMGSAGLGCCRSTGGRG